MTTILIVDDDFDVRDTLADVLGDEGYAVAGVCDGIAALEWLREHAPPSLILLDWMMPRCDGATFRQRQLAEPALAGIPVVLLTADAHVDEKRRLLDAAHYLTKPVQLDELLAVVEKFAAP